MRILVHSKRNTSYTIITTSNPIGGGTTSGDGFYAPGSTVTVIATPNAITHNFINWTENGVKVSEDLSYTFSITGNRILIANFEEIETVLKFGRYYNWFAATDSRIAESGWHVPSNTEWNDLGKALGGNYISLSYEETIGSVTNKLKSLDVNWTPQAGTNETGMSIETSGYVRKDGESIGRTINANFWTVDEQSASLGKYKNISGNNQTIFRSLSNYPKQTGFSIRLVRDSEVGWTDGDKYTDIEGNTYPTVKVEGIIDGVPYSKIWTAQNLIVQKYNDNAQIPIDPVDWSTTIIGAMHSYD